MCSTAHVDIFPEEQALIETSLAVILPKGYYGRLASRSGLAVKNMIHVCAGVIDEDYTGEIKVCLINHGSDVFSVKKGDKIAQLIVEKCAILPIEEALKTPKTERGINGFGSTGLNEKKSISSSPSSPTLTAQNDSENEDSDSEESIDSSDFNNKKPLTININNIISKM